MNTPNEINQNYPPVDVEDDNALAIRESKFNSVKDWIKEHQLKLALGVAAVSTTVTLTSESFDKTKDQIIEAAPWVAGGLAVAEVGWIGGAAIMLTSIGDRVGNPLKIRGRMPEIAKKAKDSLMFKTGFALNYASAVGQAALVGGAVVKELPPQAWGVAGIAALDLGATIALRQAIWGAIKEHGGHGGTNNAPEELDIQSKLYDSPEQQNGKEISIRPKVRKAAISDIGRLAEIDLARYKRVYGEELPNRENLEEMFRQRLANASSDWMYVCEVGGKVEGFVTGFRTNKPIEEFNSWEDSTANGTLENCVDPEGQYVYVANLTVNPIATKLGGESMLMGYLLAQGIEEGIEYGYFISRMPLFSAWVRRELRNNSITQEELASSDTLDILANQYANYTKTVNDKEVKVDYELRLYEESGFEMGKVVPKAFEDPQSLDYGVLFKANVPPQNSALKKIVPLRKSMAIALRKLSNNPKLLEKVF